MATELQTSLTTEQHQALSAHERSVSLAAGAGCGKTFVLTERFLSYLDPRQLQPSAELTELVAITFTDAAAREMRDRIRRRCYERLQAAEAQTERAAWRQLLSTLDGARISTIHSFCATLLRSYAAEAALDPRFEVLDPPTAELLRLQSLDDHLRQLLLSRDERLLELATHFELRNLRNYAADLLGGNVQSGIERWHDATPEQLVAHWQQHYHTQHAPAAASTLLASEPVQRLRDLCASATVATEKFQTQAQAILDVLRNLNASDEPQLLVQQLSALARVQGVCTAKDWDDPADFEQYKDTCKAVRDVAGKSILSASFAREPLQEAAKIGLDLLQLVAEVADRYQIAKQQRNALEFDDLLATTHALLSDSRCPQVQRNLAHSTQLLMVDEFQDTDPLQVAIVKALCGDDWSQQGLFVVGDFKQSIYRFRGAEPRVSSELRATLPEDSRLSLTTNFRSQPAILDFVNALFHDAFSEGYEPLVAHRRQLTSTPAVELLWSTTDENQVDQPNRRRRGDTARARMQEARYIARRLAQLLDDGKPMIVDRDTDGEPSVRPLQLGDIAILLRTLSDVAIYEEALREYGLDYYLAGGHAFYAQQEIYDVLHLLRSIASPLDELSLAGLLRSPMFALTDETLYWLHEHGGSLNGGLFGESQPEELTPADRAKAQRAATILGELREMKDQLLVAELLSRAISMTGYDAMLLTEFLGHRKWANVQKLVEQARALDRTRPGDLHGFVTQLSEFVVRVPKEPLAATRAEGDVIRIMTIHYAKGLEFPLVVVPDLERSNNRVARDPVFDEALGPLVPSKEKQNLVGWDLYQFAEQEQEREERKRLFYVACTRAADYLLLSSSIADIQRPSSDWMNLLADHFDLTSGNYTADLPDGYNLPDVRVITTSPATIRKPTGPARGADLQKLIIKTNQLAETGKGKIPDQVQTVPPNHRARRRFSFSRLSGKLRSASERESLPQTRVSNSDARGLGSLIHAVLQRIDFTDQQCDIGAIAAHLAPQFLDDDWQAAASEATKIVRQFLNTPRAKEMANAKILRREVEFILPWPLDEEPYQGRYLHGFIDCLYQDQAGGWYLIDYKSNHVNAVGVAQLAEHYTLQMYVYRLACQRAIGQPPTETVLHFLRPGEERSFSCDDAEALELAKQLNQAMEAQLNPSGTVST